MRTPILRAVSGTTIALAALALTACSTGAPQSDMSAADSATHVKIVATTTQICDYVTQIATDSSPTPTLALVKTDAAGKSSHMGADPATAASTVELTCLLAPNASAHEHEMTPGQTKALSEADVMFVNGVDLEHFLDAAVESSGFKGTMGVTTGVLSSADIDDLDAQLAKEKSLPYTVDRGSAQVELATWPFPPDEGETEAEFRFDPHVWTSPKNVAIQVSNIGAVLEKVSPTNKDLFAEHVASYQKVLSDLDAWASKSLSSIPAEHRVLFTSHDAFGYFSKAYGIKFIGAALSDFSHQQDATAEHIAKAAQVVKDSGATALFAENSNNSKSIEAIAQAAGVTAVIGDDALYGDSLGPDGSPGATYTGSIVHNVTTIVTAWKGTLAPLPDTLK